MRKYWYPDFYPDPTVGEIFRRMDAGENAPPRASRLGSRNTEFPAPFADADRTRIPVDRLLKPFPCEAPPAPHFTIVTNDVGMRFRALVVPLPIREVGIGGTLPEVDQEDMDALLGEMRQRLA